MVAGRYELTYQARATIDGRFAALPATIEAMYQHDEHARTAREAITVAASPSPPERDTAPTRPLRNRRLSGDWPDLDLSAARSKHWQ